MLGTATATAQTAHYSGSNVVVANGASDTYALALDSKGNLFAAGSDTGLVQEYPYNNGVYGAAQTIASLGSALGIAIDSNQNLFVSAGQSGSNAVFEIPFQGGAYGSATPIGTGINGAFGVAVDGTGDVFVATDFKGSIQELKYQNGAYTAPVIIASGFSEAVGVAVDPAGNVFATDYEAGTLKKVPFNNGTYGAPVILRSNLSGPTQIAFDSASNLYVAELGSSQVIEFFYSSSYSTSATMSSIRYPVAVALDSSGDLFTAGFGSQIAEMKQGALNFGSVATNSTSTPPPTLTFTFDTSGSIAAPQVLTQGVAGLDFQDAGSGTCTTNGSNHMYNAGDTCTVNVNFKPLHPGQRMGAVQLVGSNGTIAQANVYGTGTGPQLHFSTGTSTALATSRYGLQDVAVDGNGNLYATDRPSGQIFQVPFDGVSYGVPFAVASDLVDPYHVALDGAGNLFVTSSAGGTVTEVPFNNGSYGRPLIVASNLNGPEGLTVDGKGNLFVADFYNHVIQEIPFGNGGYGAPLAIDSSLAQPTVVTVDSNGNLFVADAGSASIKEIPFTQGVYGTDLTIASNTGQVTAMNMDSTGALYFLQAGATSVYSIPFSGGSYGAMVTLENISNQPTGLGLDSSGRMFLASPGSTQLQELDFADLPALQFNATAVGSTSTDSPQTLTLTNSGNADLVFSAPPSFSSQTLTTNFTLGGSCLPSSSQLILASGTSCNLAVSFAPAAVGSFGGSLTLTDNNLYLGTLNSSTTQSISVAGTGMVAATQLSSTPIVSQLTSGGSLGQVQVTVEDANGNPVTSSTAQIQLEVIVPNNNLPVVLSSNASAGVATFNLSQTPFNAAGLYTVQISSTGLTGVNAPVTVIAGPATYIETGLGKKASLPAGFALGQHTVSLRDAYSNIVTTSAATFQISITGPQGFSYRSSTNAVAGQATIDLSSVSLNVVGPYNVVLTSANLPTVTATWTVVAGAANQLVLGAMPSPVTSGGNLGTVQATVTDAYGNTVLSSSAAASAVVNGPGNYAGTVSANAVSGVLAFNFGSLALTTPGTYMLTLASPGLTPASATFTVSSANQTVALPAMPNVTFGAGAITLPATSSAGLPIAYTVTGPAALSGTTLTITGAGTISLTATQAGNGTYLPATATASFTVAQAPATVALATSSGVAVTGSSVTLTAQVSAQATAAPTGTVTFLNGSTVLGAAPVSAGTATLSLATLPTGVLSLTASYGGDKNYLVAVSAAVVTGVQDFGIAPAPETAYQTIGAGGAANFTFALTPGSAGFGGAINLAASGLPPGATYSFQPASMTLGATSANAILVVQTAKPATTARNLGGAAGVTLALLALPFGVSRRARRKLAEHRLLGMGALVLLLGGAGALTGCGSNGAATQPLQSYVVTVTATSGSVTHATTVALHVQ